jgi:hypothetical protein
MGCLRPHLDNSCAAEVNQPAVEQVNQPASSAATILMMLQVQLQQLMPHRWQPLSLLPPMPSSSSLPDDAAAAVAQVASCTHPDDAADAQPFWNIINLECAFQQK